MNTKGFINIVFLAFSLVLIILLIIFWKPLNSLYTGGRQATELTTKDKSNPTKATCDSLDFKKIEGSNFGTILCIKDNQESKGLDLNDMYDNHYHGYELNNNNLFLIRRIGYDGYPDDTWTDELWMYKPSMEGKKLYSAKGLDFRVSPNGEMIGIVTNDFFRLLDRDGNVIKSFEPNEIIANAKTSPMFGFHAWGEVAIWLDNTLGPSLTGIAKINTKTFSITKYDLTGLLAGPEFSVNIQKEKIAFSNYPALFDEGTAADYQRGGAKVNLVVYDLNTKVQEIISTSITKKFNPTWVDEDTLEFDRPDGTGRQTVEIY